MFSSDCPIGKQITQNWQASGQHSGLSYIITSSTLFVFFTLNHSLASQVRDFFLTAVAFISNNELNHLQIAYTVSLVALY